MRVYFFEKLFFNISYQVRWVLIIAAFLVIAALDFSTPPACILAYLYVIPILVSISFLKPIIAKTLVVIAISATLLNLVFPHNVLGLPLVVMNRLLAVTSILISSFFMVRYIRYQQQLQEQEQLLLIERNMAQLREDLIATLTHDMKTPLLGEQKTLQYFLAQTFGAVTDEQQDVLKAVLRSNHRLLELVDTLMSVYRHDNLGVQLEFKPINLDDLIADVLTEFQYLAHERQVLLEYTCKKTPPALYGDALQIRRVLANLLQNALNYTPSGGTIQVSLKEQANHLMVEVADSGEGLAPGDLENVFQRFYRAGQARQVVGTGLGLYLSRQISPRTGAAFGRKVILRAAANLFLPYHWEYPVRLLPEELCNDQSVAGGR